VTPTTKIKIEVNFQLILDLILFQFFKSDLQTHKISLKFKFNLTPSSTLTLTYLPHRNLTIAEEKEINLTRHLRRLLHVNVVVEEVLDRGNRAEGLQLLPVTQFWFLLSLGLVLSFWLTWL